MTRFLFLAFVSITLTNCTPDYGGLDQPNMRYTDLKNAEVKFGSRKQMDLDGDGTVDFSFQTQLVGDPILVRDRLQFYVSSKIKTNLLNSDNDESPVLKKGEPIMLSHPGYTWYEISAIVLTEKITTMTPPSFWQGRWSEANHQYLPVQIDKAGKLYMGWIELSMDKTAEKLVLHKAAIALVPNQTVRAGY
ncbi:hypothetical protein [Flavisolibacter tropicus]|uniref:Uncharacterized protein n=1 Tax=Flavisolibacter tropicus TaxID=1492898 RepID=A0A172U054_9BACT|nr:hypothetical protein [Flavisolibacter tropicus]ANE52739.1 hypothetical protein SY85_21945 [Flavisolibacter tropicus]